MHRCEIYYNEFCSVLTLRKSRIILKEAQDRYVLIWQPDAPISSAVVHYDASDVHRKSMDGTAVQCLKITPVTLLLSRLYYPFR